MYNSRYLVLFKGEGTGLCFTMMNALRTFGLIFQRQGGTLLRDGEHPGRWGVSAVVAFAACSLVASRCSVVCRWFCFLG